MNKLHLFFGAVFLLLAFQSKAIHGGSIKGIVVSSTDNELLPGVLVQMQSPALITSTNEIGSFSFADIPDGEYTLTFSVIGFQSQTILAKVTDHETTTVKVELKSQPLNLSDVEIRAVNSSPLQTLSQLDIRTRPVQSSQDILRMVPGLFIAQHAGGGKAEQIFLRGFDIDHGTDIALFADGIPVNMVSHAHGQGYADLHFLIPELVQKVDMQKGPYDARTGNFATAGQVRFETPGILDDQFVKLEAGEFNTYRAAAAVNLLGSKAAGRGSSAYIAGENLFSNGYFDAPQNFKRTNLFGKFRQTLDDRQVVEVSLSNFNSSWLASGQIPERAIAAGTIGRFGAIDATEGGSTSRSNFNAIHYWELTDKTLLKNQLYVSKYDFELYSNFTFFLNDPVNGDQIRQKENRRITGYNSSIAYRDKIGAIPFKLEGGVQIRYDDIKGNELSRTINRREVTTPLALGDVQEINAGAYADWALDLLPDLTLHAGGRFDQFHYAYTNALDTLFSVTTAAKNQWSPKFSLNWDVNRQIQLFVRTGSGFHSNDTRVVTAGTAEQLLPRAWGQDVGLNLRPYSRLLVNLTGWRLGLEQEFVYVGDEGVVEPGGKTLRYGVDVSARWQLADWLFFDGDYTWTKARATEEETGFQYIPLAPVHTGTGGFTVNTGGFTGSLRGRWLGDRAANEDDSVVAEGYFLLDAQLAYAPKMKDGNRPLELTLSAQNLTNTAWKEAQFLTESRLRNETEPVEEIHFTPGTPLWVKGGIVLRF